MANIQVNDIKFAGTELFEDTETFISDLDDNELDITGGALPLRAACCGSCNYTRSVVA